MEKTISGGNRTAVITLDGTECEVKFDSTYTVFSVKSDSEVTVALESGKAAGDDGVMICSAGESIMYPHMQRRDRVYITGSGNVSVFASNEAVNPFKMSAKGGESSAAGVRPNLICNPDFKVNQRGVSGVITEPGYFVDRWELMSGSVTVDEGDGIFLDGVIRQKLENVPAGDVFVSCNGGNAVYADGIVTVTAEGERVLWVKLEYGSTATMFITPEPALEIIKCQRYYYEISGSYMMPSVVGSNVLEFGITDTTIKRMAGAITAAAKNNVFNSFDGIAIVDTVGNLQSGFGFTIEAVNSPSKGVNIVARKSGHGLTNTTCRLRISAACPICLDTEEV